MNPEELVQQNDVIISLLGRVAFPEDVLKKIVTKNKQNPNAYVKGYNACNGEKGVTEIAKIVGVSQPTMTPILQSWKTKGIIYQKGKNYMKLYEITEEKEGKNVARPKRIDGENNQEDGFNNPTNAEEPRESESEQSNPEGSGIGTL